MTRENFFKGLHLSIKERNQKVVPFILDGIIDCMNSEKCERCLKQLNFNKFLSAFIEHLMKH